MNSGVCRVGEIVSELLVVGGAWWCLVVLGFFFRDIEMMFSCTLPETKIANHPKILGLVQIRVMSFLLGV